MRTTCVLYIGMLALGIALLSYDGHINFGLVGDYDLMWDLDAFADDLEESLAELADAAGVELSARERDHARVEA